MHPYPKIQSLYKRTEDGRLIIGDWSEPWIEELAELDWLWTEKIDGTNIRVRLTVSDNVEFLGRSDKAQLPKPLEVYLHETFTHEKMVDVFDEGPICLYGEGYGAGIQAVGSKYGPNQAFVLFDVKVRDVWLKQGDIADIAARLGIAKVPIMGVGTLAEAERSARAAFFSFLAPPDQIPAEGLVCRPMVDLFDRHGNRIIVKVKTKDYARAVQMENVK